MPATTHKEEEAAAATAAASAGGVLQAVAGGGGPGGSVAKAQRRDQAKAGVITAIVLAGNGLAGELPRNFGAGLPALEVGGLWTVFFLLL